MDLPFTELSQRVKRSDICDETSSYCSSSCYSTECEESNSDESDPGSLKEFIVPDSQVEAESAGETNSPLGELELETDRIEDSQLPKGKIVSSALQRKLQGKRRLSLYLEDSQIGTQMLSADSVYGEGEEVEGDTEQETDVEELVETVSRLKEMVETVRELLYSEVLSSSCLRKYRRISKAGDISSI